MVKVDVTVILDLLLRFPDKEQMQKLIWIIIGSAFFYFYYYGGPVPGNRSNFAVPQQAQARNDKKDISRVEFSGLFEQGKPFHSLANDRHYTIIEVYLDTCSICKRLESGFKPFLEKRQDVLIKRVHFPESGMNIAVSSAQEAETMQARIDSYKVCGTPHIEVYGPDRNLLAADECGNKKGLSYLREWISAETGISRHRL